MELHEAVRSEVNAGKRSTKPFGYQGISDSEQSLRACAEIYATVKYPKSQVRMNHTRHPRHAKIRIGYLAGEFRHQATSILMASLFELHDKHRFELFAFDNGWDDGSKIRTRLEAAFDAIIDITRMSDLDAATLIHNKEIDILVNLNGYFGAARHGVFSYKPSPIQVNYLGFPGTIGSDAIDYLIADRIVIPEDSRQHYVEKIVYLPDSYQVNDPKRVIADTSYSRQALELPDNGFVFCCFNNNYKITPATFDGWMRILSQVPGSVLWLLQDNATAASNLRREAEARGVDAARVIFAKRMPLEEHLARHRAADLFLDSLPYNAHTTASDALWAGLPVLTCLGQTFPGRVGASLLHAIGLPELVTMTQAEYEALAVQLATQSERLDQIRQKLVRNRLTTPLFDVERFTRNIETAYTAMLERYQAGLVPEHIVLD